MTIVFDEITAETQQEESRDSQGPERPSTPTPRPSPEAEVRRFRRLWADWERRTARLCAD